MLNEATIIGHLGSDPDVRDTKTGGKIATLSIATTEKWKDKATGERKEQTEWHRVICYDKLADIAEKYIKAGDKVYICGKIQTRRYTDQNGVEKYSTQITLGFDGKLIMLSPKETSKSEPRPKKQEHSGIQKPAPKSKPASDDDGIPFDDEICF